MSPARRSTWTWCDTSAWARPIRARRSDTHIPGSPSETGPVRGPGGWARSTSMRSRSGSPMARRQRSRSSRVGTSTVRLDAGQEPRSHRVRLHQSEWVRVCQVTELARTFVLGVFTWVVQMPYGHGQGASPEEGSAYAGPVLERVDPPSRLLAPGHRRVGRSGSRPSRVQTRHRRAFERSAEAGGCGLRQPAALLRRRDGGGLEHQRAKAGDSLVGGRARASGSAASSGAMAAVRTR